MGKFNDLDRRILAGDVRAAARLMRLIDDRAPRARSFLSTLQPHTGSAYILGVTGNPGSGKSTLVNRLIQGFRQRGQTVACVAVDPTSPFSGGAILGDRVRMQDHADDPGVFIRSVATRGNLGGLSRSTPAMVQVMDAMGYDVIIVETVGVGQDEIEIVRLADTSLVVLVPGLGDDIQAEKAGLMEIADVFVINKSDLPGSNRLRREVQTMLSLYRAAGNSQTQPEIVETSATANTGIDDLLAAIDGHRNLLESSVDSAARNRRRCAHLIRAIARTEIEILFNEQAQSQRFQDLVDDVQSGKVDPYTAAESLTAWLGD